MVRVIQGPPPAGYSQGAPTRSLQILASFDAAFHVAGVAPFGMHLAVLAWQAPPPAAGATDRGADRAGSEALPVSTSAAAVGGDGAGDGSPGPVAAPGAAAGPTAASTQAGGAAAAWSPPPAAPEAPHISLQIVHRSGEELASDSVDVPTAPLLLPHAGTVGTVGGGSGSDGSFGVVAQQPCRLEVFYTVATAAYAAASSSAASPLRGGSLSGYSTPRGGEGGSGGAAAAASTTVAAAAAASLGQGTGEPPPPPGGEVSWGSPSSSTSSAWGPTPRPAPTPGSSRPAAPWAHAPPPPTQSAQQQQQRYKWWRDGEEPLYYVVTPAGIVVGRPRDGNDRVAWLSERARWGEALEVAETDLTGGGWRGWAGAGGW